MARPSRSILACFAVLANACAVMPRELNLTPLWFHRLDGEGNVLEWDCLWPVLHYERTPDGGDDFRVRPVYRRVTEPHPELPADSAVEHQFLWPLGRVRVYPEETSARLFPLWSWRSRVNDDGERDIDWYLVFPFVWGGWSADRRENYFGVFPLYADLPEFLVYDRFHAVLFPLYLSLEKGGHEHTLMPWPFVGFSSCAENGHQWFRVLPFYGHDIEPGRHVRRFALFPFVAWSTENLDTRTGPVHSYWFWPFFGWRTGPEVNGWMVAWPFFQSTSKQDHFFTLTLFWPLFRYYWNRAEDDITQWWLWPIVSRVISNDQRAWTFLWPLFWWREYLDPDGRNEQTWLLPFFWRVVEERYGGPREDFLKVWPLLHHVDVTDAGGKRIGGEFSMPSPWPWRDGNAYGVREAYGFLWEIVRAVTRAPDDHALDVAGRLYTERNREDGTTASVPFLFNYERSADGRRTLRLLQFLPIPLGGGAPEASEEPAR